MKSRILPTMIPNWYHSTIGITISITNCVRIGLHRLRVCGVNEQKSTCIYSILSLVACSGYSLFEIILLWLARSGSSTRCLVHMQRLVHTCNPLYGTSK